MATCIISSLLAFAAGFIFHLFCAIKASDESWEKFKKSVDEIRKKLE